MNLLTQPVGVSHFLVIGAKYVDSDRESMGKRNEKMEKRKDNNSVGK